MKIYMSIIMKEYLKENFDFEEVEDDWLDEDDDV